MYFSSPPGPIDFIIAWKWPLFSTWTCKEIKINRISTWFLSEYHHLCRGGKSIWNPKTHCVMFTVCSALAKMCTECSMTCDWAVVHSYLRRRPLSSWCPSWPWRKSGAAVSNTDAAPLHEASRWSWGTVPGILEWCSLSQGCSGPPGCYRNKQIDW